MKALQIITESSCVICSQKYLHFDTLSEEPITNHVGVDVRSVSTNTFLMLITGSCEPTTWSTHRNMNVDGGRVDSSTTLESCQSQCVANFLCTAIDWNSADTIKCWLHGPWSASNTMKSASGFDHHRLTRRQCPGN